MSLKPPNQRHHKTWIAVFASLGIVGILLTGLIAWRNALSQIKSQRELVEAQKEVKQAQKEVLEQVEGTGYCYVVAMSTPADKPTVPITIFNPGRTPVFLSKIEIRQEDIEHRLTHIQTLGVGMTVFPGSNSLNSELKPGKYSISIHARHNSFNETLEIVRHRSYLDPLGRPTVSETWMGIIELRDRGSRLIYKTGN